MTLEKPASKLGTHELLKEQPGIGVGSVWIARTRATGGHPVTMGPQAAPNPGPADSSSR